MASLTRDQVRDDVVGPALKKVADFTGDFEDFRFDQFHDFALSVFLQAIASNLAKTDSEVTLNEGIASKWATLKDAVDHVYDNHTDTW